MKNILEELHTHVSSKSWEVEAISSMSGGEADRQEDMSQPQRMGGTSTAFQSDILKIKIRIVIWW